MISESEYNAILFDDVQNMTDDKIIDELAYYAYSYGGDVSKIILEENRDE